MDLEEIKKNYKELDFKTKEEAENVYMTVYNEMKNLIKEFEEKTKGDEKLQEFFKNDEPQDRYTDLSVAGSILGGMDLRNLWRENGKLDGEMEKYPYSKEQMDMIHQHKELKDILDYIDFQAERGAYDFQFDEETEENEE